MRLVSWGIPNWLRHTLENFLMARYWPTLICINCVTIVITITVFTICLGTVLPFPWKFSRTSSRVALLNIQWGQQHHFQSHQGVLIPSAHPMEKSISVALVSYLPLILHFVRHIINSTYQKHFSLVSLVVHSQALFLWSMCNTDIDLLKSDFLLQYVPVIKCKFLGFHSSVLDVSVMPYHWVIGSWHVEMMCWSHIQGSKCPRRYFLHISTVEMSGTKNPVMWHHILEEQNPMSNCG